MHNPYVLGTLFQTHTTHAFLLPSYASELSSGTLFSYLPRIVFLPFNPRTQTLGDFHPTLCYPRDYYMGSFPSDTILVVLCPREGVL